MDDPSPCVTKRELNSRAVAQILSALQATTLSLELELADPPQPIEARALVRALALVWAACDELGALPQSLPTADFQEPPELSPGAFSCSRQ